MSRSWFLRRRLEWSSGRRRALASFDRRNHARRATRTAELAGTRSENGVDDFAAIEHDEVVHAALLLAAVAIQQIGVAVVDARRKRLAEFGDDLLARHTWIDRRGALRLDRKGGDEGENHRCHCSILTR